MHILCVRVLFCAFGQYTQNQSIYGKSKFAILKKHGFMSKHKSKRYKPDLLGTSLWTNPTDQGEIMQHAWGICLGLQPNLATFAYIRRKLGILNNNSHSCKHKPKQTYWTHSKHQTWPEARANHLQYLPKHQNTILLRKTGHPCRLSGTAHFHRAFSSKPLHAITSIQAIPSIELEL